MEGTKRTLVVNLFAGPGTGKSSTMGSLFSELKWRNINCDMAPEYAKEIVWTDTPVDLDENECKPKFNKLMDQKYIFGKQQHRVRRLDGKVDVIITDSPILLSLLYGKDLSAAFKTNVRETHDEFYNLNIFLERKKPYHAKGRLQTADEAKGLDVELKEILESEGVPYVVFPGSKESIDAMVEHIIGILNGTIAHS